MTAGDNNFNDFAENQLTCVPENISFQNFWGSKYHVNFQVGGHLTPRPHGSSTLGVAPRRTTKRTRTVW